MTENTNIGKGSWNAPGWAAHFEMTSRAILDAKMTGGNPRGAELTMHNIRRNVFLDTVSRVRDQGYVLPDGSHVDLSLSPTIVADTRIYDREIPARSPTAGADHPTVSVVEGDCLAARELVEGGETEVCVLNMASATGPGGGVHWGAGAQEEHLFRSSDYFRSRGFQHSPKES